MKASRRKRIDPDRGGGIGDKLYTRLSENVIGQDEAVRAVVSAFREAASGLLPAGRPVANFLFLGPTGSGKTLLAEQTSEALAGFSQALVTVDCGEFQHSHDIAKLIGSPPGYIGHKDTEPMLSQKALDRSLSKQCRLSFVLFDEIEKANDALWNLLLGILSKGRMRSGSNKEVNFERCMIFMTSNLGADLMEKFLRPPLGLAPGPSQEEIDAKLGKVGADAARKKFTPEFNNRIDYTLTFTPLSPKSLQQVLDLELMKLQDVIFERLGESSYVFTVTAAAREQILSQGTDSRYGARFLNRAIRRLLTKPLANLYCTRQLKAGDLAVMDWKNGKFEFDRRFEGLTAQEMAWAQSLIYAEGALVPTARQMRVIKEPAA